MGIALGLLFIVISISNGIDYYDIPIFTISLLLFYGQYIVYKDEVNSDNDISPYRDY